MARRIDKLQINALNASNSQILVARGGQLAFDDPANVFSATGDAGFANISLEANFANTAGISNISLEANFANTAGISNISLVSNFANTASIANLSILANVANTVVTLSNFTTANLSESGSNLYFTNARALAAVAGQQFTLSNLVVLDNITANTWSGLIAGDGINIEANGRISSSLEYLTLSYAEAASALGTENFSNLKVFSDLDGINPVVYSLHATNMSSNTSYLTVRVTPAGGSSVLLANLLHIPGDSSVEILRKPQAFKENDRIEIQSFNQSGTAQNNTVSVYLSYSATQDPNYLRQANSLTGNSELVIFQSVGRTSQIESIKLVNTEPIPNKVSVYIKDGSNNIFAWITSNISIPPHSLIEVCEYSKALPADYKIAIRKL